MKPSIEDRLNSLEDEQGILRTLYTYGHALDYGLEAEFLDCFTEDALLYWATPEPINGRAAIAQAFRSHSHAPAAYHKHLLIEPLIRIQGDSAVVESMFARLDHHDDGPRIRSFGRYRDILQRGADDRWRFKERRAERESRIPDQPESWSRQSTPLLT